MMFDPGRDDCRIVAAAQGLFYPLGVEEASSPLRDGCHPSMRWLVGFEAVLDAPQNSLNPGCHPDLAGRRPDLIELRLR